MKIKTKDLKQFFALSTPVRSSNILPILSYIKLEDGKLTKTNLRTFVIHKITDGDYDTVLLDEKILSEIIKKTTDEEIEVKIKGKEVFLSDSVNKVKFPLSEAELYPKFPEYEKNECFELDREIIGAISIASKNVLGSTLNSNFDFVHLKNGYVFGSDRNRFYIKKFKLLPDVIIDIECAGVISNFRDLNFYQNGNYNFFETVDTLSLYAFCKHEVSSIDFERVIPNKNETDFFDFKVSDLVDFCDLTTSISRNEVQVCVINGNKLYFNDNGYEQTVDREIPSEGTFKPDVHFNPRLFSVYFKSLGTDKLRLCKTDLYGAVSVWDIYDPGFVGMIRGIVPETNGKNV